MIYKISKTKLEQIKEKPFKLEREIQNLFEANLMEIMGIEFVKTECVIQDRRIDTLAFDPQTKNFVIIEYKRDRNSSVVDQGMTYLNLMLQYKADFILTYNETLNKNLHSHDIDWSQTRVAFISTSFTENQRYATNFKDLSIELWEVKRYANDVVIINPIKKTAAAVSIKPTIQNKKEFKPIVDEIKVFTEEDHLQNKSDEIVELYEQFKHSILNLDNNIEINPKKQYIAFKINKSNICDIEIQSKLLKIYINLFKGELEDSKHITQDISQIGHWGNGDYLLKVSDDRNIEYIMSLIKQAIKN